VTIDRGRANHQLHVAVCTTSWISLLHHVHVGGPFVSGPVVIPIPNIPFTFRNGGQSWTWPRPTSLQARGMLGWVSTRSTTHQQLRRWRLLPELAHDRLPGRRGTGQSVPESPDANTINGVAICTQTP